MIVSREAIGFIICTWPHTTVHCYLPERTLQTEALKKFQVESILAKIYVFRCHDYMQLIALSHILPEFLAEHLKVR